MTSLRFHHAVVGAALAAALNAQAVQFAPPTFSALYVFGDSLSDTGNNKVYLGTAGPNPLTATSIPTLGPYDSGYYSNGPVWANAFAAGLNLSSYANPSLLGGGNFAHGGAKVSADGMGAPAPLPSNYPPSLKTQLNSYLGVGPNPVSSTALYVVAGGGNDVRKTGDDVAADPANAAQIIGAAALAYATDVGTMAGTLKALGAQNVVVWNVPDLGRTPAVVAGGPVVSGTATFISSTFNNALSVALNGSGVTLFDTFGIITTIATTGSYNGFQFTNTTLACGFVGNSCDASTALFWDGIHPTAYAHSVLAGAMLTAVPEPSSMLMLAVGIGALLAWRRRA